MDEVDKALEAEDSAKYRRSVYDEKNQEMIELTNRELTMVRRMMASKFPQPEFDANPDYVDFYSGVDRMQMPVHAFEPKRRFIPSKWEQMKVAKIVRGIKEGTIKPMAERKKHSREKKVMLLWDDDGNAIDMPHMPRRLPPRIPAPREQLPGNELSYHPPKEVMFTEEQKKAWEETPPEDREIDVIPTDYKK